MELPINPLFNVQEVQKMGMLINPYRFNGFTFPTNGLVAYYPFSGNANDLSGNGYNGTIDGATLTTDRNGNADSAYYFDGNNDKITLPNAIRQAGNFSLSFWVNVESWTHTSYPSLFGGYGLGADDAKGDISITRQNTTLVFDAYTSSSRYFMIPNLTAWPTGSYYLLTFQYESDGYLRTYKNGISNSTPKNVGTITITQNRNLYIGYGLRGYFKGTIDCCWIYNRGLSTSEMATLI